MGPEPACGSQSSGPVGERVAGRLRLRREPGLLLQLAPRGLRGRFARLDAAGDRVPVGALPLRAVQDEELDSAADDDEHLVRPAHAGNTTSARSPSASRSSSVPPSSSRTSALTIESPVPPLCAAQPGAVVGDRERDVAVSLRELDAHRRAAVLERVLEELREHEGERGRPLAGERDRLERRLDLLPGDEPLDEHRAQPVDQLAQVDVVVAVLRQHLVHRRDRQDPVDRVGERLARIHVVRARLQPQERGDRLEVVLDAVMDLLGEHAAHHRAAVLERDRGMVRDRLEELPVLVGERDVAVADELADLAPLPAQRQAHGVAAGAALRPRDLAVLEHERGARRVDRRHGRRHDRLERLLEVQRLRDGLGDLRERLQLVDAALRLGVQLRVLDRLRDLGGDRHEQVDLGRPAIRAAPACGR